MQEVKTRRRVSISLRNKKKIDEISETIQNVVNQNETGFINVEIFVKDKGICSCHVSSKKEISFKK